MEVWEVRTFRLVLHQVQDRCVLDSGRRRRGEKYEKSLLLYRPDQAYCASQAGQADACVRVHYDVIPIVNWVFLLFVLSFLVDSLLGLVVRLSFHRNSVTEGE